MAKKTTGSRRAPFPVKIALLGRTSLAASLLAVVKELSHCSQDADAQLMLAGGDSPGALAGILKRPHWAGRSTREASLLRELIHPMHSHSTGSRRWGRFAASTAVRVAGWSRVQ